MYPKQLNCEKSLKFEINFLALPHAPHPLF